MNYKIENLKKYVNSRKETIDSFVVMSGLLYVGYLIGKNSKKEMIEITSTIAKDGISIQKKFVKRVK